MTYMDFEDFSRIQGDELLRKAWTKTTDDTAGVHVKRITERFNQVTPPCAVQVHSLSL